MGKENLNFPLYIKPYDGSLSKDNYVINNQNEITKYHLENPKLIFMEYISNLDYTEFTVDAYYDRNSNLKCAVPRERIVVRSGEVSKAKTHKNSLLDLIFEKLSFIEGAKGCLTIQFFVSNADDTDIIGIEINPRFGGGFPLSYLAGANYPKWLIEEYFDFKDMPVFNNWENKLMMLRYDGEVLVRNQN